MKTFKNLITGIAIICLVIGLSSSAWSGQPSERKSVMKGIQVKGLTGKLLYTNLSCRNPGSAQDIVKTPIIKNTTGKIIDKGSRIYWYASDGDKGTITAQKMLAPNMEIQGTGKPAKNYTCTAKTSTSGLKPFKIKKGAFDLPPKLESMMAFPSNSLPKPPGSELQAGSTLYLKGMRFGPKPGRILIYFGNSPVQLENIVWKSVTQVHGTVPMSVNGRSNQKVSIKVESEEHKLSNAKTINFRGREEKVLTRQTVTFTCGTDANRNVCNNWSKGSTNMFVPGCPSDQIAICGMHANNKLAVGDDEGTDHFNISLKNGWTFKNIKKTDWKKTSGDEKLQGPSPSSPVGQSFWGPSIDWVVSPGDYVLYGLEITVEGPVGTSPY